MIELLRRSYELGLITEGTNRLIEEHQLLALKLQFVW